MKVVFKEGVDYAKQQPAIRMMREALRLNEVNYSDSCKVFCFKAKFQSLSGICNY